MTATSWYSTWESPFPASREDVPPGPQGPPGVGIHITRALRPQFRHKALHRRARADVYTRPRTAEAIGLDDAFPIRDTVVIGNFEVKAISVSHDAVDPVAFRVRYGRYRIGIVSDLGRVDRYLIDELRGGCDILAFESNHDVEMLRTGPYSPPLKARILSDHGHLSNEQAAEAIARIVKPETHVVLTHLSQENNRPDIAYSTVSQYLANRDVRYASLECASQDRGGSSVLTLDES